MDVRRGRSRFLTFLLLLLFSASAALASEDSNRREVRIALIQGDVRLSRGDGKHPDLQKPWEQAEEGQPLEQGFAVATGNGRAEIEFEDGSTVYLAENSVLLFRELFSSDDRMVTRVSLPAGSATFFLDPVAGETYFLETPTDRLTLASPDVFFARVDAYLDATGLTPEGETGETMFRSRRGNVFVPKGRTLFIQQGEVVAFSDPASLQSSKGPSFNVSKVLANTSALGLVPFVPASLPSDNIFHSSTLTAPPLFFQEDAKIAPTPPRLADDWDKWVSNRLQERKTVTAAALKASGLSSPIPGLNDLYLHGSFFQCEPYGTCWEPFQEERQWPSPQATQPRTQSPSQSAPNAGFQPQTVEWMEPVWGDCGFFDQHRISRVAHNQKELDALLRDKAASERSSLLWAPFHLDSCLYGNWIPHRGHYARVLTLTPRSALRCVSRACKVVHPPHPVWVRSAGKVGFVPRHPNDVKGKPLINLKHGIFIPPAKSGESLQLAAVDSSQKVKILDKAPREVEAAFAKQPSSTPPPEIRGHLVREVVTAKSGRMDGPEAPIVYDYKSRQFLMPGVALGGAKGIAIPVGGISSSGKLGRFADGHSNSHAQSFARAFSASSHNAGINSGSWSGAGRGSASHSSGSSYSGGNSASHSTGSVSSGSSSHSSSGGNYSGSSSSSSSTGSSSSSSSGGGSRVRP